MYAIPGRIPIRLPAIELSEGRVILPDLAPSIESQQDRIRAIMQARTGANDVLLVSDYSDIKGGDLTIITTLKQNRDAINRAALNPQPLIYRFFLEPYDIKSSDLKPKDIIYLGDVQSPDGSYEYLNDIKKRLTIIYEPIGLRVTSIIVLSLNKLLDMKIFK